MSIESFREHFSGRSSLNCDAEIFIVEKSIFHRGTIEYMRIREGRAEIGFFCLAKMGLDGNYSKSNHPLTIFADDSQISDVRTSNNGIKHFSMCVDGGLTRQIAVHPKDHGNLNLAQIGFTSSDVPGLCWNCGKINDDEAERCECGARAGTVENRRETVKIALISGGHTYCTIINDRLKKLGE